MKSEVVGRAHVRGFPADANQTLFCLECADSEELTDEMVCEASFADYDVFVIHDDGYREPTEVYDRLDEAIGCVRKTFDIAREFVNKPRPGWESYWGNDLRWPNWVELTNEEMASVADS